MVFRENLGNGLVLRSVQGECDIKRFVDLELPKTTKYASSIDGVTDLADKFLGWSPKTLKATSSPEVWMKRAPCACNRSASCHETVTSHTHLSAICLNSSTVPMKRVLPPQKTTTVGIIALALFDSQQCEVVQNNVDNPAWDELGYFSVRGVKARQLSFVQVQSRLDAARRRFSALVSKGDWRGFPA
jgi:hypothetical protein